MTGLKRIVFDIWYEIDLTVMRETNKASTKREKASLTDKRINQHGGFRSTEMHGHQLDVPHLSPCLVRGLT